MWWCWRYQHRLNTTKTASVTGMKIDSFNNRLTSLPKSLNWTELVNQTTNSLSHTTFWTLVKFVNEFLISVCVEFAFLFQQSSPLQQKRRHWISYQYIWLTVHKLHWFHGCSIFHLHSKELRDRWGGAPFLVYNIYIT